MNTRRALQAVSLIVIALTVLTACSMVPQVSVAPNAFAPACDKAEPKSNCLDVAVGTKVVVKYHPKQGDNIYWDQEWTVKFWIQANALGNGVSWDLYSDPDNHLALKHGQSNDYLKATSSWGSITFKVVDKGNDGTALRLVWPTSGTLLTSVSVEK